MGRERDVERAYSVNGVPIRLTYERWFHITENHDDLASYYFEVLEAVEKPEFITRGNKGSLKATKNMEGQGTDDRSRTSEVRCQSLPAVSLAGSEVKDTIWRCGQ